MFKFCKITDNISETLEYKNRVAMEDPCEIICGLWNCINTYTLEGHFRSLKPSPYLRKYSIH